MYVDMEPYRLTLSWPIHGRQISLSYCINLLVPSLFLMENFIETMQWLLYFSRAEELETALMEMVMQDNRRQLSAKVCLAGNNSCFALSCLTLLKEICATMGLSMGCSMIHFYKCLFQSLSSLIHFWDWFMLKKTLTCISITLLVFCFSFLFSLRNLLWCMLFLF